jgi:putative transposase
MATKRHPGFWSYLKGMAEENTEFTKSSKRDVKPQCKHCGSVNVIRYGYYGGVQRLWCKECRRKFADNKAPPGMKSSTNQIAFTLTMYLEGKTLNNIRQNLQKLYNSYPSDSTLYEWIERFTKKAIAADNKLKPAVGDVWIVLETPLIVGDSEAWFWDVIDIKTGFILASRLCYKRTTGAAEALMIKAVNKAAKLPRVVVTDKLARYLNNIELVFGAETRRMATRTLSTAPGTKLLQKLDSALKARTAIVRRFKNTKSARTIIRGWPVHYNYLRPREIAHDNTPAHRAGISHQLKIKIR